MTAGCARVPGAPGLSTVDRNLLFGEGNVNTDFEAFTSQHQCSFYCEWFKLERFDTVEVDEKDSDGVPYEWGNTKLKS